MNMKCLSTIFVFLLIVSVERSFASCIGTLVTEIEIQYTDDGLIDITRGPEKTGTTCIEDGPVKTFQQINTEKGGSIFIAGTDVGAIEQWMRSERSRVLREECLRGRKVSYWSPCDD